MRRATILTALLLAFLTSFTAPHSLRAEDTVVEESTNATTVYLVRHAEKAAREVSEDPRDPHLTAAGQARATELARVLGEAGIGTIFSTPFHRTRETAAPLAQQESVEVTITPIAAGYSSALAQRIRADHTGQTVLVVGHSNTTPEVIRALGVTTADSLALEEDEYDNLFIVTLPPQGGAWLAKVHFGAETP